MKRREKREERREEEREREREKRMRKGEESDERREKKRRESKRRIESNRREEPKRVAHPMQICPASVEAELAMAATARIMSKTSTNSRKKSPRPTCPGTSIAHTHTEGRERRESLPHEESRRIAPQSATHAHTRTL